MKINYLKQFTAILIILFLASSCRKDNDNIIVHISKEDFSFEDQKEIGETLKSLILDSPDQYKIVEEDQYPEFYNYLNTLMDMLSNTDLVENRSLFQWDATIIHDDAIRSAFITPGGHLFIYTGLLKFIRSESELVGILAHEINYADTNYLIERLKSEFGKEFIGDLLLGHDAPETRHIAHNIGDLVFSSDEVTRADHYSIDLICPFQYNALGLYSFLENADRSDLEIQWLETRPGSSNRMGKIEEWAANCGEEEQDFLERYDNFKKLLP